MYESAKVSSLVEYENGDELDVLEEVGMGNPAVHLIQVANGVAWVDAVVYANVAVASEGVLLAAIVPSVLG